MKLVIEADCSTIHSLSLLAVAGDAASKCRLTALSDLHRLPLFKKKKSTFECIPELFVTALSDDSCNMFSIIVASCYICLWQYLYLPT